MRLKLETERCERERMIKRVCERERERVFEKGEGGYVKLERERGKICETCVKERKSVCVSVCVCVKERERERERESML